MHCFIVDYYACNVVTVRVCRLLEYDAQAASAFNDREGQHEDADCRRSIGLRTPTGIRMVPLERGMDCSGVLPPPSRYSLGSYAEATHLTLRETLAGHLHAQHLQHQQKHSK